MPNPWLSFTVTFLAQLCVVLLHAHFQRKLNVLPTILWFGLLSAIVPGPLCDLLGKYLGLGEYALGFGPLSLALNTVFMYSLFAANTLLMQGASLLRFCAWTFVYIGAFEITNVFFPMWTYSFAVPSVAYFAVAFGAPLVLALIIALSWHVLFKYRFAFFEEMYK